MNNTPLRLTRKQFLHASATGSVLFLLQACGGGGSDSPAPAPSPQDKTCSATNVTNNHGHTLSLTADQLASTTDLTLNIQGTASHNHTIKLTVAQLALIKAGTAVTVDSSTDASHSHTVTANCV